MELPPQGSDQSDVSLPAISVGALVHLLVLDHAPQALNQNDFVIRLASCTADLDLIALQGKRVKSV